MPTTTNVVNKTPVITGTANQLTVVNAADNSTSTLSLPSNVVNSGQALFFSYLSSTQSNATGDGTAYTIVFDTTTVNQGNFYSTVTGAFTAPINGNYLFCTSTAVSGISILANGKLDLVTTTASYVFTSYATTVNNQSYSTFPLGGSVIVPMSAGNTAKIVLTATNNASAKTVTIAGSASPYLGIFSGLLLPA